MINKALEYLQREYLHNLDMIEGLRRDLYDVLYAAEDGVLICDREGGRTHMLSCRDAEAALRIAKLTQSGCGLFVAHQADTVEPLRELLGFDEASECWQAIYLKDTPLPVGNFDIRRLDFSYAPFVAEHYNGPDCLEYMQWQINDGAMLGAFVDGELAGFIGRHDQGALGVLEVLPEYRRRGIATALESAAINRELQEGHVPYCHLYTDNLASRALQQSLGLSFADKNVWWLYRK